MVYQNINIFAAWVNFWFCLGNIGEEYSFTRHNIGFEVADALAGWIWRRKKHCLPANCSAQIVCLCMWIKIQRKTTHYFKAYHPYEPEWKGCELLDAGWKNSSLKIFSLSPMILLFLSEHYDWRKGSDGGHNGSLILLKLWIASNFARLRFALATILQKRPSGWICFYNAGLKMKPKHRGKNWKVHSDRRFRFSIGVDCTTSGF